jgi:hypothetical protein
VDQTQRGADRLVQGSGEPRRSAGAPRWIAGGEVPADEGAQGLNQQELNEPIDNRTPAGRSRDLFVGHHLRDRGISPFNRITGGKPPVTGWNACC